MAMMVALVIGVYISFGMWDPTRAQKWIQLTCPQPEPDCPAGYETPPLIVISLDGFRASYLQRNLTATLRRIAQCGVSAPYMRASYPTKTFVNHYSIATVKIAPRQKNVQNVRNNVNESTGPGFYHIFKIFMTAVQLFCSHWY